LLHAARVRKIVYPSESLFWRKVPSFTGILKVTPPGEILLPNILSFSLKRSFIDGLSYTNTLLGPQIQSLELSMDYDNEALRSFLSQDHLYSLLHVNFSWYQGRLESRQKVDIISKAICSWNQLHTLSVKELTPVAFTHIATFPDLQNLVLKDVRNSQAMVFPAFAFPSLKSLEIGCKDVQFCIDIVKALSSCCLTSVRFKFVISPSDVIRFIDFLASTHTFHTSLRKITFYDITRALSGLRYGKAILSSLFVFSNLTSVNLTFDSLHDIDDNVMETLCKTWPRLQYLSLDNFSWGIPVMTLMCLVPLATFCLELEELRLDFDARFDDSLLEDHVSSWVGVRNTSLCSLNVGRSPIDGRGTQLVLKFLQDIFPNIKILCAYGEDYNLTWEEVDTELQQR
jgi:hypothetical protein